VYNIQRFPVLSALKRTYIHPFVKPSLENGRSESPRVPDESILSALPWSAGDSLEIAFDVLVKTSVISGQ
jgi:hypothetical protein